MRAQIVKINNDGEQIMDEQHVLDEERAMRMFEFYIMKDPDMDDDVKEEYEAFLSGENERGREQRIGWLVNNGKISETSIKGKYSLYLYIVDEDEREVDEYYESRLMKEKWVPGAILATLTKWDGPDQEIVKQDTVGTYEEAFRMLEDYILNCGDADEYVLEQFEDYAMKRDIKGRKQRISALERCGETSEEFLDAGYGIVLTVDEIDDDWNTYPDEYAESSNPRFVRKDFDEEEVKAALLPKLQALGIDPEKNPEQADELFEMAEDRGNMNAMLWKLLNDKPLSDMDKVWMVVILADKLMNGFAESRKVVKEAASNDVFKQLLDLIKKYGAGEHLAGLASNSRDRRNGPKQHKIYTQGAEEDLKQIKKLIRQIQRQMQKGGSF